MENIKEQLKGFRSHKWIPSKGEAFVYLIVIVLLFVWAQLVQYTIVNRAVRKESRCYKQKRDYLRGGVYSVEARDTLDRSMYKIDYDLVNKSYKHACSCKDGDYANTFHIKAFNMNTKKTENLEKSCMCDADFKTTPDVTYKGYPGLVRYMQDGSQDFFLQEMR